MEMEDSINEAPSMEISEAIEGIVWSLERTRDLGMNLGEEVILVEISEDETFVHDTIA
ncbi:hypothetical protein Gorai_009282 [Gossypium raimondii]|uniref:Uncharacterized protein n=1 Tax=Gossypium raimondii TaxID=29730 RepID=A0A7J8PSM7_GOSRA|nr:hypothetical protein [Gossypium raimondii]